MVRDFATDESHGERGMSVLKLRLDGVRSAYDAAAAELETAKRAREDAEQELGGNQVQVAIAVVSIHGLEATISHLQEEISQVRSDLDALKGKGDIERDEFISQMDQLNTKIRKFQQMVSVELNGKKCSELSSGEGQQVTDWSEVIELEGSFEELNGNVSNADSERSLFEEQYEKDDHDKVTGKECHRKGFTFLRSTGKFESSDEGSTFSDDETILELLPLGPSTSRILVASTSVNNGQNIYASDQPLSTLPPLPDLEIPQRKGPLCIDGDANESDNDDTATTSSQGSYIELHTIQDEYVIGGPSWEAMIAPITGLALEEEEELMIEGQILLANDQKANRLITLFDEEERAMVRMLAALGQPLLTMGTFPTSRSFLLNLPLIFVCKEKDTECSICKSTLATKYRCHVHASLVNTYSICNAY
ncbi:hypothetical protein OsJ_20734 [Oryza sativa Japonica Group]|nr:hypothetical protein OsJ_20734 [Oryza sativa Japonica Group]